MIILIRTMSWEARVRANVAGRLKRRGAQAALARQLSVRDQSWLSRYVAGEFSMDVATQAGGRTLCPAPQILIGFDVP